MEQIGLEEAGGVWSWGECKWTPVHPENSNNNERLRDRRKP